MKKKKEGFYLCLRCKKGRTNIFTMPCDKCVNSKKYKKELEKFNKHWQETGPKIMGSIKSHQDVTALLVDRKTGKPVWVTKEGKKLDYGDSSVRYDLKKDPHGWRVTGQKTRERDKYGKRI